MTELRARNLIPSKKAIDDSFVETGVYIYKNPDGSPRHKVVRKEKGVEKKFTQSRMNPDGSWTFTVKGLEKVPYRLPELIQAVADKRTIFWVEGEKCADGLVAKGFCATTVSGGANGKFEDSWQQWLRGGIFVVVPDKDEPGEKYARRMMRKIIESGGACLYLSLNDELAAPGDDIWDWLNKYGGTPEKLKQLVQSVQRVQEVPEESENLADSYYERVERYSDVWLADQFVAAADGKLIYVDEDGWYRYDEGYYIPCGKMEKHRAIMKDLARQISRQPEATSRSGQRALRRLMDYSGQSAILNIAKSWMGHGIEDFDAEPLVVNFANGYYDMGDRKFRKHQQENLFLQQIPFVYEPKAKCELWQKFLLDVMDGDIGMIEFLQMSLGYSLTALRSEQQVWFCFGSGQNGKSKFLNVIRKIMGTYSGTCRAQMFMDGKRDQTDNPSKLVGVRFVSVNECGDRDRLDEQLIKDWTGGEEIPARFLYAESFDYEPVGKLWFRGNHKPMASSDDGTWRRFWLIPFIVQIPDAKRDRFLEEKLLLEKQGIINWMVQGYEKYEAAGSIITAPLKIIEATEEYREEVDPVGTWIRSMFRYDEYGPGVQSSYIYSLYREFAEKNGLFHITQPKFSQRIKAIFRIQPKERREGRFYPLSIKQSKEEDNEQHYQQQQPTNADDYY